MPNSAQAWIDLCSSPAYRNADRAMRLLERESATLSQLAKGADRLCGIGSGDGSKDALLLKAFPAAPAYIAADFSQTLLEISLRNCAPLAKTAIGVKLDVFRDDHLAYLPSAASRGSGHAGPGCEQSNRRREPAAGVGGVGARVVDRE